MSDRRQPSLVAVTVPLYHYTPQNQPFPHVAVHATVLWPMHQSAALYPTVMEIITGSKTKRKRTGTRNRRKRRRRNHKGEGGRMCVVEMVEKANVIKTKTSSRKEMSKSD